MSWKSRVDAQHQSGFTLLEVIVVISIIGILAAIGASLYTTPSARLYANDVRALVQQARYEAVKLNVPIAVVWVEDELEFRSVRGPVATPCDGVTVLNRARAAQYPRINVSVTQEEGDGRLVWLPSGQARSCGFAAFGGTIARISDDRVERNVTVTLTGRVTIQ